MLQLMYLELGKIFKQLKREKKSEKKMRERTDVYGCTGIGGGRGIAFIVGLLCIVLQRFATLVCFVAYGFNMRDIGE